MQGLRDGRRRRGLANRWRFLKALRLGKILHLVVATGTRKMFWITEITTVAAELLFLSVLIVVIRKIILSRLGWAAFVSQGKVELGYSGGASEADVCTKNLEKES